MLALLEGPYGLLIKAGAVLLGAVLIFGGGYYEGHKNAVNAEKARVVTHILVQTKALPGETKLITQTVTRIQTVHDKVYVDVPKLVPDDRACDLPADAVGLLNANRGSLSTAP